jgi:hypothetical protein
MNALPTTTATAPPNVLPASTALPNVPANAPPASTALLNAPPAATASPNPAPGTIRQPIQPNQPIQPDAANAPPDDAEAARKRVEMRARLEAQGMMPEEIEEVLMDMEADGDEMEA